MKTYNPRQSVELFHLLFLNQLGRKLNKRLYAVKGGCNMRFYFNSIRYSEDMDIDIQIINKDTLAKNVNQILTSTPFRNILRTYQLEILSVNSPKQTQTTQRWKLALKSSTSTLPLYTKIEFSRGNQLGNDVIFEPINSQILKQYSLMPIMANHYSIQKMYEQKILALALRTETQSRDVFDLYVLIASGISLTSLEKETKNHLAVAITNAKSITFTDFKGQVIAYLFEEDQKLYDDKMVWEKIVEKVVRTLTEQKDETN